MDVLHHGFEVESRRNEEEVIKRREILLCEDVYLGDSYDLVIAADEGIDGGTVEWALVVAFVHY